jgi:hypothetical protein
MSWAWLIGTKELPSMSVLLLLILSVANVAPPRADTVLAHARRVAAAYADTAAVRAQGFGPFEIGRLTDLTPFQGQHWLHRWRIFSGSGDLDAPSFVMFVPIGGRWRLAGLAYSRRVSPGTAPPDRLAGTPAPWHLHQPCIVVPGEGEALADGADDCRARGGAPRPPAIAMVHAWTGVPNPEGPFAHDNVALPFLATGLEPPGPADLATPAKAHRTRSLGLALAETYGAILPYARLVEVVATDPTLGDSLRAHRAALRELVPRLLSARRERRSAWNALVDEAIRERQALQNLYLKAAPSPAIRAQLEREDAAATGRAPHSEPGHHSHH